MFKDAQKELKRLEELLEEEEEELLDEEVDEFDEEYDEEEPETEEFDDFDQEEWEQLRSTLMFRSGAEKFRRQLAEAEAYNSDRTDAEPVDLDEEEPPERKALTGLAILAVLLTMGIVAMVIWFLLGYMR